MNHTTPRASCLTLSSPWFPVDVSELCAEILRFAFLEPIRLFLCQLLTVNCEPLTTSMNWFERKIRRYEHRRWTTDDDRRVQPFHWGLEHIGGSPDDPNPGAFVREYAQKAIESSREWYAAPPAADYRLDSDNVLAFT